MTDIVLSLVTDQIPHADLAAVTRIEDRLHDRLRILREQERPADDARLALALCYARRRQIASGCCL